MFAIAAAIGWAFCSWKDGSSEVPESSTRGDLPSQPAPLPVAPEAPQEPQKPSEGIPSDLLSALKNLGFKKKEAEYHAERAVQVHGADAPLETLTLASFASARGELDA